VGVATQTSKPTLLVQLLLANLSGSTVNVSRDDCQNQRLDGQDTQSKHVRPAPHTS